MNKQGRPPGVYLDEGRTEGCDMGPDKSRLEGLRLRFESGDRSVYPDLLQILIECLCNGWNYPSWLKELVASMRRKPGRPVGSVTRGNTVGKKRARQYYDLLIDTEKRPSEAAKLVSDKFDVPVYQVFKDAKRHGPAIVDEIAREAETIEAENSELAASLTGPVEPHIQMMLRISLAGLKGEIP